ncbi:MAG: hypothetical protein K2K86_03850 [Muribaculaceae bacterium]|nr:hypothetical protein [Muribaculaceae bacterium]
MLSLKHILILTFALLPAVLPAKAVNKLYKIEVDSTGIWQVTPEQLRTMGYDRADEVTVYGCGAAALQSFDFKAAAPDAPLPEVPSMATDDGRLVFYAEGPEVITPMAVSSYIYASLEFNSAEKHSYYFIGPKQDAARVAVGDAAPEGLVLTTHTSALVYHPMTSNPAKSGTHLLGDDITRMPGGVLEIKWPTADMTSSSRLNLRLRAAIKAQTPRLSYTLGTISKTMSTISGVSNAGDYDIKFDASDFKTTSISASSQTDECVTSIRYQSDWKVSYAAIEQATLTYQRNNRMDADGKPLTMLFKQLAPGTTVAVSGITPSTVVWDVTDPANTVQLPVIKRTDDNTLYAVSSVGGNDFSRLVAFNPDTHPRAVTLLGPVETERLAVMEVPEMLILTAPSFKAQAERLAGMHRTLQNMSVAIVEPMEVFNEYSSGATSPYAIRRFMKSLYDREPGVLKHLLIIGPSSYDPSGRLTGSTDPDTHIITYQIENFTYQGNNAKSYCTDAFYGMLDDDDTPDNIISARMSINVGRISGINESLINAYVDKVYKYLTEAPTVDARSHALVIGDYGDKNGHTDQALAIADSIQHNWAPHTTVNRLMLALYNDKSIPLSKMISLLDRGVGYIAYSGHGSPTSIGSNMFFKRSSASLLNNTTYPFVMLSTCYTLSYDREENGGGEALLYRADGGAIAAVGAGRSVQMNLNQYLNIAVGREYFTLTDKACTGDIFRQARNSIMKRYSSNELAINTSCYNLLGDPALPVNPHSHGIMLDDADKFEIRPLSTNTLSGRVTDADGVTDASFNGRVIANLYAPEVTDYTHNDPSGTAAIGISRRENLITTAEGTVANGVFDMQIHCPEVSFPGSGHVLTVHALSTDGRESAVTSIADLNVADLDVNADLAAGAPVIESLYINTPGFNDGDVIDGCPTLYATVTPSPSGFPTVTALGRSQYIDLDGKRYSDLTDAVTFDADGKATVTCSLGDLTDGTHTATLVVSDNAGNHASQSCYFHVVSARAPVSIVTDTDTATDAVEISLSHTLPAEPAGRLIIEDAEGRTVVSRPDTTFPYTWNLTDNDGNDVADGRYTIHALLKSGQLHTVTDPVTIVVVKE